jgi:hypothetical protein
MLLYVPELEVGDGLASLSFTLDDLRSLFPAHAQFSPTESSFSTARSSLFPSVAHTPPPVHCSPWEIDNVLPGPSESSPVSGPSEFSVYAARHVSRDNVRHAVVSA